MLTTNVQVICNVKHHIGNIMGEGGIDIAGVGEVAKAIPEQSWNRLTSTACCTFEKCVAPITEVTGGVGRLISAKFDRLVDAEKVLAAETIEHASRKAHRVKEIPVHNFKPDLFLSVMEHASKQTDSNLRELWANLLAQELLEGEVHPEVVKLLSRISTQDAQTLAEIAEKSDKDDYVRSFSSTLMGSAIEEDGTLSASIGIFGMKATVKKKPKFSFSEKFLESLGLIERAGRKWELTAIGEGFIASVSEPIEADA